MSEVESRCAARMRCARLGTEDTDGSERRTAVCWVRRYYRRRHVPCELAASRPKRRAVRVRSGEPMCSAEALRSARNGGHGRLGAEDGFTLPYCVLRLGV